MFIFVLNNKNNTMKKSISSLIPFLLLCFTFVFFSFSNKSNEEYNDLFTIETINIPENVKAIIDKKCMGCHNNESKSGKSKTKLNFDKY